MPTINVLQYAPVAGTTSDAGAITNAFSVIQTAVNGLDDANVATNAGINVTKLGITGTPDGTKYLRDDGSWQPVGASIPVATLVQYAGATAPSGWLLCDGTAVNRVTYAALFAVVGVVYGTGDGSTTFNLPDLRGRVAVGKGSNADVSVMGANDGVAEGSRSPKHNHTHTLTVPVGSSSDGNNGLSQRGDMSTHPVSGTIGLGGSRPNNMPAYLTVNMIIKT